MPEETIVAVRFPRLYRALRSFVSAALELIRTKLGTPDTWPTALFPEITYSTEADGRSGGGYVQKFDVGEVIRRTWPEVATLESYKVAGQELEKLVASTQFGDLKALYLGLFMTQYITGPNAEFDNSRFKGLYDDLEEYLGSSYVKARVFLQLQQLRGDTSTLDLDPLHSIVKADERIARQVWSRTLLCICL